MKKICGNEHYTAVQMRKLDELGGYSLAHPRSGKTIEGKVFLKESTGATGTEISFNKIPPFAEVPYLHIHHKNEETYIILRGSGLFQVDGDCFPVSEGSIVRVAPAGVRGLKNTSPEPMVYQVIQSREHSLEEYSSDDAVQVKTEKRW